jgi:hypothetical protein
MKTILISILVLFTLQIKAQGCYEITVSFKYKKDTLTHTFEPINHMESYVFGGGVACDYYKLPITCKNEKRAVKISRKLYKKTGKICHYSGKVIDLSPNHFVHYFVFKKETSIYKYFKRKELKQL